MTFSAAQQHLLQRLGIIQLQLSTQLEGVDFSVSVMPNNTEQPDSTAIPTLDWLAMPVSALRDDLLLALTMLVNNHEVPLIWVHSDCLSPHWLDHQLYLPEQLDATSKRALWHYLCQQEPLT